MIFVGTQKAFFRSPRLRDRTPHLRGLACLAALAAVSAAAGRVGSPCDFDGRDPKTQRGRDDLAVYEPATGNWYIRTLDDNRLLAFGLHWAVPDGLLVPADYDGDGRADLGVYEPATGNWYIRTLVGARLLAFGVNWGGPTTLPVPADYDGDGRADLGVYEPATGNWYIRTLAGARPLAVCVNWGGPRMVPVPADYDGDGRADLGVYERVTGNWYIRTLRGALLALADGWGWRDAWPVPADYDGDGRADLAVYYRPGAQWFIKTLGDDRLLAFGVNWGTAGMTPVPGDYDGDGRADLAVYARATGNWYLRTLGGNRLLAFGASWGTADMTPLQSFAYPGSEGATILAFGDSITWGGGSSTDGPATGYPIRLERKLPAWFGGCFTVINAGKPGEATWGGVDRLPQELARHAPDTVLLMEGVNDALWPDRLVTETGPNLRNMVGRVLRSGAFPVVATLSPVICSRYKCRAAQAVRIEQFNPYMYRIARDYGIPLARVYERITSESRWETTLMEQVSANHPNDEGYIRVRDAFFDALAPAIRSGRVY
jgi:lysophospholipase L1-like esterase